MSLEDCDPTRKFASVSLPSPTKSSYQSIDNEDLPNFDKRKLNANKRDNSEAPPLPSLPASFGFGHQPALALEPTVDSFTLASLQAELPTPSTAANHTIVVCRPVFTQKGLDQCFGVADDAECNNKNKEQNQNHRLGGNKFCPNSNDFIATISKCCKKCGTKKQIIKTVQSYLPIIDILRDYSIADMLLADILCGITIGMVNVAHGMTHALIANVQPIVGLYASFYPVWLYTLFGTSRTLAYGTLAITSILVGNAVQEVSQQLLPPKEDWVAANPNQSASYEDFKLSVQTDLAICLTFLVGLIEFVGGIVHLGFMTVYFADAMVTGFTTATMIYVVTSQAKYILGFHFDSPTGVGNILKTWILVFESLNQINWVTFALFGSTSIVLLLFKYLINPVLLSKLRMRFPIEAIVLVCATLTASELDLATKHNVSVVGNMTNGLPPPKTPVWSYMGSIVGPAFVIALVNFAVTVSLAEMLARKNGTEIDSNQECFAYGVCNFVSSFFFCIPSGGSVSRSCIQDSMNPKTQLVGFVQSVVLLLVLLWMTSFFSELPQCVLAAIVIVALSAISDNFREARKLWDISKPDFVIWVFSFLSTILLDIQIGLVLSVIFSFMIVVVRGQLSESQILGNIPGTDLYRSTSARFRTKEYSSIKIFRYCGEIHFATASLFRKAIYKQCGVNPRKLLAAKTLDQLQSVAADDGSDEKELKFVIIDLSMCCFIDYGGLRILRQVCEEYKAIGITVILAACPESLQRDLIRAGFYDANDTDLLYASVHDAVMYARRIHYE